MLWHVEEIVPLFNYIKKTHSTTNPINVAGVDLNLCNASYSFAHLLYDLIFPINPSHAKEVYKNDSIYVRVGVRRWLSIADKEEIDYANELNKKQPEFYSRVINFIDTNRDKFPED